MFLSVGFTISFSKAVLNLALDKYFIDHLALSEDDANMLHQKYYKEYGLAIEGLVRHHKVDPLEYNEKVDDALPLDGVITPDPQLRKLLEDIDRSKVRLWLFTNAYITHAKRVLKLLAVEDLFEGITYCDYSQKTMICKPHKAMYDKAEAESGVASTADCYFVGMSTFLLLDVRDNSKDPSDDSHLNCRHAQARGWTTAHLLAPDDPEPETKASEHQIRSLEELRTIFPQFFKSADSDQIHSQL